MIAGIDEAGRGCLAGPVYAAAVVLGPWVPDGINDSKKLSPARREALFERICASALDWSIARAEVEEIDQFDILRASLLAMQRAVAGLRSMPREAWVDGPHAPRLDCPVRTIVGGDAQEPAIMAASILAKVARDRELIRLDAYYPGYGFARHKGYGTPAHLAALRRLGPCALHRRSFSPCAAQVQGRLEVCAPPLGDDRATSAPAAGANVAGNA
ncbi:RNase HII [Fontimonas thermophila]|uniref:Ribonuclease HII n=1 Tax=Fontimonas thermophila TaxID=1076937 RepID=A0A1I2HLF5_9GAMM|nr:ribonuclease HII [Fontimonas thermophila]SFF30100.1 RNase HII [Fontimonas thermophila]